eukprot:5028973-Amphidinium_carterae.1
MELKDRHINPTAKDNGQRTIHSNTTMEKENAQANNGIKVGTISTTISVKEAGKKGETRPQVFNIADKTEHWHQEPDNIQFQVCSSQQQLQPSQLGTPSQPLQSQTGTLYNDALYPFGAVISVYEKTPTTYKEFWAIVIDTGAAVSVCPTIEQVPIRHF